MATKQTVLRLSATCLLIAIFAIPVPGFGEAENRSNGCAIGKDRVLHTIRDWNSGKVWVLLPDADHPGGPGRLLLSSESSCRTEVTGRLWAVPVLKAGDQLLVEEHTAMADVHIHAIALRPARVGQELPARLLTGGATVRVIATGPGTATLAAAARMTP